MKIAKILFFFSVTSIEASQYYFSHEPENSLTDRNEKIAIVGAGAGGSSAAYYLQKYTNHSYDITIFEKSKHIGGRSTTVSLYDNSSWPIELGASIFVSANKILMNAVEEFNLTRIDYGSLYKNKLHELGIAKSVVVWDGNSFILEVDDSWYTKIKLLIKYNLSLLRMKNLTKSFVSRFLDIYYDKAFPFESLKEVSEKAQFLNATDASGLTFLRDNGVSDSCSFDLIQAMTRVNYAQNLNEIHAIGTLVSLAADGAYQVEGGNWKIFQNMIEASGADIKRETEVTAIKSNEESWSLQFSNSSSDVPFEENYDKVIIASPMHLSNISSPVCVPYIDYVTLHVTLISVNSTIRKSFFGDDNYISPTTVLTTLRFDESETPSNLPFFSVAVNSFIEEKGEFVYKIFSPSEISDSFLNNLFEKNAKIGWTERKVWKSYPKLHPTRDFTDFNIASNLWYLNTIEPFISTMETSALAGSNVAGLISRGQNKTRILVP